VLHVLTVSLLAQDKKHDEKAGVKSMAVRLGKGIRLALSLFGVTCFACLSWAGCLNGQGLPFYVMSVIAPFSFCLWQIWSFDDNDPKNCWETFTVRLTGAATSAIFLTYCRQIVTERQWFALDWSWTTASNLRPSQVEYINAELMATK
jgi:1,4-dihydroxy-2-naphthoate octaprenyltransferase